MHVLIVDDDTTLRTTLAELAANLGHTAAVADSAWSAFDIIEAASAETIRFDAIITDVQMADGNGLQLLKNLQRLKITPPTYVHSSEPTFTFQQREQVLATYVAREFGAFASFKPKDQHLYRNVAAFLTSISAT